MSYYRANIVGLEPYVPGEQPAAADVIKLNTNENPYPPPPEVIESIRNVAPDRLRRYPSPDAAVFRHAASEAHGVSPCSIIATNGGDELLRLAMTAFCDPDRTGAGVAITEPGYSLCPILATIHDTPVVRIPLQDDFSLPPDVSTRVLEAGSRLLMVSNPHAPSGRMEPLDVLRKLAQDLQGRAVLLVDEAYVDFASADALPLVTSGELDNVLLLRSLSKGYSLAGLRFGYGIGHRDLVASLDKIRDSYNTDILSQTAATTALQARDTVATIWASVIDQRSRLTSALRSRDWEVLDSESNFVLASPPRRRGLPSAESLYRTLQQQAIFVRHFDSPMLSHRLRITVGTEDQITALIAALDALASTR